VVFVPLRTQMLSGGDADRRRRAWSLATVGYAVGQAVGAYGLSYIFALSGRYDLLFEAAAVFWVVALLAGEWSARLAGREAHL